MAKHVFHWKHGWIPLDHASLVEARRRGLHVKASDAKKAEPSVRKPAAPPRGSTAARAAELGRQAAATRAQGGKLAAIGSKAPTAPVKKPGLPKSLPATGGHQINRGGWAPIPPASASLDVKLEAFYSDFGYEKANGRLTRVADESDLNAFLGTMGDLARAKGSDRKVAAKRLLDHASKLNIALPADMVVDLRKVAA